MLMMPDKRVISSASVFSLRNMLHLISDFHVMSCVTDAVKCVYRVQRFRCFSDNSSGILGQVNPAGHSGGDFNRSIKG